MNHGLTEETVAEIHRVLAGRREVEKALLYGSRAKGNYRPGSDIDLVLVGPELDQRIIGQIADELEDGWLPYRFDLSILAQIHHPALLDHIHRVGVVFYEKQPAEAAR